MSITDKPIPEQPIEKEWEVPANPEAASDSRDKEQAERLIEEAKRHKENLTDVEDDKE